MFKSLRNKFLIINMVIISLTMLISFVTIYITTYKNSYEENKENLDYMNLSTDVKINIPEGSIEFFEGEIEYGTMKQKDSPSFSIIIDEGGNASVYTFIEMSEDALEIAKNTALAERTNYSVIDIEDKNWMYKINSLDSTTKITFLDVTSSENTLQELLTTFVIVSILTFIVIFLISLYSANKSIKPISDAFEKQKEFIANASHELKTPLSIINANYDVLMANKEDTIENQIKWLDYIKIGTDRMSKLIKNLLLLARSENQNDNLEIKSFNISKAIDGNISIMEASISEKNIKLVSGLEHGLIVKGNESVVNEIFMILYENAIKYTDINGEIIVKLYEGNKNIVLSLKNTTTKLTNEELPYIFDRFYKGDKSRKGEDGSYGLGLSIAKSMAKNIKADINVKCEKGFAVFDLYIPKQYKDIKKKT